MLGVEVTTVDSCVVEYVENAIRPNTRHVFVESIANPDTQIPDLQGTGDMCRER
jgi:O-acetylhomoserine (thiol)-lyase